MSWPRRVAPLLVAVALGVALIALLTHSTETTAIVGDHRTPELPPGSPPTRLISDERLAPAAQASMEPPPESVTAPTLDVDTIELDSSPHGVVWSGRLRTRTGGAVPSWHVRLWSSSIDVEPRVDPDGRFRWRLAPGRYYVAVYSGGRNFELELPSASGSGTGKSATHAVVPAGRDMEADIIVVAGRVSGRILGAQHTGKHATIELRPTGWAERFLGAEHGGEPPWYAISDGGAFGPVVLPPGKYMTGYAAWEDLEKGPRLGSTPLLDATGAPAFIHVLDGDEIAGLELNAEVPKDR